MFSPLSSHCRGFCYFNSVAIAAKLLQQRLDVSKTLIVDWVSGAVPGGAGGPRAPRAGRVPCAEQGGHNASTDVGFGHPTFLETTSNQKIKAHTCHELPSAGSLKRPEVWFRAAVGGGSSDLVRGGLGGSLDLPRPPAGMGGSPTAHVAPPVSGPPWQNAFPLGPATPRAGGASLPRSHAVSLLTAPGG